MWRRSEAGGESGKRKLIVWSWTRINAGETEKTRRGTANRIDNARNISVEDATICQLHGNAVVEIRSEWMSNSLGRIGWHQALQTASRDISCLTWVEVTAEPETLMTTSDIQLNPLVRAQRG